MTLFLVYRLRYHKGINKTHLLTHVLSSVAGHRSPPQRLSKLVDSSDIPVLLCQFYVVRQRVEVRLFFFSWSRFTDSLSQAKHAAHLHFGVLQYALQAGWFNSLSCNVIWNYLTPSNVNYGSFHCTLSYCQFLDHIPCDSQSFSITLKLILNTVQTITRVSL